LISARQALSTEQPLWKHLYDLLIYFKYVVIVNPKMEDSMGGFRGCIPSAPGFQVFFVATILLIDFKPTVRLVNPHHPGWYWFVPCFDAYRKGNYELALDFVRKVNMPGFWRTNLAVAAACGQLDQREAAGRALSTLLEQRPDIGDAPHEGLAIWWTPEMVEHLVAGLRKAGLKC
jgi:hypothetical protein